ncbi:MAG: Na+/H+ antiporter [Fimbriiglobus sp.]
MHDFEVVVVLGGVAVLLTLVSQWLKLPYPILLVVGGLLLSLQPWAPKYMFPPEVVFLAFLPPVLYAAAFNTHWKHFRRQIRAISLLAVGLVLFTTVGVAIVAHELTGMAWGPAFILGAVVSPPDAVAATTITKQVRVPKIITTLLEGESLVNDASALVAYRVAIAAVLSGVFSIWDATLSFFYVGAGGILCGLMGAYMVLRLHRWIRTKKFADAKTEITITLLTPYALYLPAEHAGFSGVLAVVTAGLWVGTHQKQIFHDELLLEGRNVWETMEFILNVLIFILMGFQLPVILEQLRLGVDYSLATLIGHACLIGIAVIMTRLLWVFPAAYVPRFLDKVVLGCRDPYPPWQLVTVVAWTGMRGVVSLAAAMAIPKYLLDSKTPFPDRERIELFTFAVIFMTLVLQGLTLPFLIRFLGVSKRVEEEAPEPPPSC